MIDAHRLADILTSRFRVALVADTERVADADVASVRALDVPRPNGFAIRVAAGWRSVDAEFVPDRYAGELIRTMGSSDPAARLVFARTARAFASTDARLWLRINQTVVTDFEALPSGPWSSFELKVHRITAAGIEGEDALLLEASAVASTCLALLLALLPLEEDDLATPALFEASLPEGAKTRVEVNRYERNPVNRATCIATHGTSCLACGLDFGAVYGPLGTGYIEVHHRVPVSRMGVGYVVDPVNDLVPLCANCHAMAHRRDPPVSLEELKAQLRTIGGD